MIKNTLFIGAFIFLTVSVAFADVIGKVKTKGLFIKDTISIHAFDDPDIAGVTCYTTVHSRSLSLEDSSSVSLSCRKTGVISGNMANKSNVFQKSKGFIKKTVVDRFYDNKRGVLVYLTYTKATSGQNNSHSISVVVID